MGGLTRSLRHVARAQWAVVVASVLVLGLLFFPRWDAGAGPYPHASLRCPARVRVISVIPVSGRDFPSSAAVLLSYDGGLVVGGSNTNARGSFSTVAFLLSLPGRHTVTATAAGVSATCSVRVLEHRDEPFRDALSF